MKQYLLFLFLLFVSAHGIARGDKADQKNKKAADKEEARFQKALEAAPNSAATYFDHANALAAISTECSRAMGYYQLALKYDSFDANIYKTYGIYLYDVLRKYAEARKMLEAALALAPTDEEIKTRLISVNEVLALEDAENKLKGFGCTKLRELNPSGDYASCNKFDSLRTLVAASGNPFNYRRLIKRFLADDTSLSPEEMYMLIIGYSLQPSYNPFSYNDINEMRMMATQNLDAAIKRGEEIVGDNPLNPTLNKELMYYYRKKNDTMSANKYLGRVRQFFNGVLYSGNGTCDRPYVSLWSKEEYNFITYLGHHASDNHYMGQCAGHMAEIIEIDDVVTPQTAPIYFNVALIYMQAVGK